MIAISSVKGKCAYEIVLWLVLKVIINFNSLRFFCQELLFPVVKLKLKWPELLFQVLFFKNTSLFKFSTKIQQLTRAIIF